MALEKLRQWCDKTENQWLHDAKCQLDKTNNSNVSSTIPPLGYRWCYAKIALTSLDSIFRTRGCMFATHMLLMPVCPIVWLFTATNARNYVPNPELIDWSLTSNKSNSITNKNNEQPPKGKQHVTTTMRSKLARFLNFHSYIPRSKKHMGCAHCGKTRTRLPNEYYSNPYNLNPYDSNPYNSNPYNSNPYNSNEYDSNE